MAPIVPLTYYSIIILAASVFGGMLPLWIKLTHRGMQLAVSFVAAMMFGVGMLHMLPHALSEAHAVKASADEAVDFTVMMWVVAGWLTMFFIERFFCYHHHDLETDAAGELHELHEHEGECGHDHGHHHHDITWSGAAFGLTIHSVIEGVALAASVYHRHDNLPLAGLGTFLVIFLHKPFDSMTIAMLMARGGWSPKARYAVNGLFALAIPVGIALFFLGMGSEVADRPPARLFARVFGGDVSLHLAQRSATGVAVPRSRPRQTLAGAAARPRASAGRRQIGEPGPPPCDQRHNNGVSSGPGQLAPTGRHSIARARAPGNGTQYKTGAPTGAKEIPRATRAITLPPLRGSMQQSTRDSRGCRPWLLTIAPLGLEQSAGSLPRG